MLFLALQAIDNGDIASAERFIKSAVSPGENKPADPGLMLFAQARLERARPVTNVMLQNQRTKLQMKRAWASLPEREPCSWRAREILKALRNWLGRVRVLTPS